MRASEWLQTACAAVLVAIVVGSDRKHSSVGDALCRFVCSTFCIAMLDILAQRQTAERSRGHK